MYKIQRILVPVDFSSCSRAALDRALSLAEQLGARITVLHVADVGVIGSDLRVNSERGASTVGELAIGTARDELENFLGGFSQAPRDSIEVKMAAGRPRERILEEAEQGKYDLLVMGTHGRTGRAHSLAGSVTESVVRMAPCPVLTARET